MKLRNGFVSNSSSSSFIVALREPPTRKALCNALGVSQDSTAAKLFMPVIDYIVNSDRVINPANDLGLDPEYDNKVIDKWNRYINDGWHLSVVTGSNEEAGVSAYIHGDGLPELNTDKVIITKAY